MSRTHAPFDIVSLDPELRVNAFRSLQAVESELSTQIHHASLRSALFDASRPVLHVSIGAAKDKSIDAISVRRALLAYGESSRPNTFVVDVVKDKQVHIGDNHRGFFSSYDPAYKLPLVVSPNRNNYHLASLWGQPIPREYQLELGVRLIGNASKVLANGKWSLVSPENRTSHGISRLLSRLIRSTAVSFYNGHAALPGNTWKSWGIPKDVPSSLGMIRSCGVTISPKHASTILEVTLFGRGDATPSDGSVSDEDRVKKALLALKALSSIVRNYHLAVKAKYPKESATADHFIVDECRRYIQQGVQPLARFDPSIAAGSYVNAYDGRIASFDIIECDSKGPAPTHVHATPDAPEDQPLFSF